MAGTKGRQREFARYPKFQQSYIRAFERMLKGRERKGKLQGSWNMGTTGEDVFHWWMEDGVIPGQLTLEDLEEMEEESE